MTKFQNTRHRQNDYSASAKKQGFTLIEMLISIVVFMLFVGIVADSYTSLAKANRIANNNQKLYREARYVFDTLANAIRNGFIDYSCIDPANLDVLCLENQITDVQRVLAVIDRTHSKRTLFKFSNGKALVVEQSATPSGWSLAHDWQPFTSSTFPIEDLSFSVFPLKNPYDAANAAVDELQWQPTVTIALKAGGDAFKTTYVSRVYGAKN